MSSRKTLKSVSVEGLKPTITLTPVIEPYGEGYRIHHIKSDSIARDGRDTFVPLRHVSKQKRRIFELEDENAKLRELVADAMAALRVAEDELGRDVMVAHYPLLHIHMRELGVEVR